MHSIACSLDTELAPLYPLMIAQRCKVKDEEDSFDSKELVLSPFFRNKNFDNCVVGSSEG